MARFQGDSAANSLSGGVADDLLFGGGGSDTLSGGDGNDVIYGYGTGGDPNVAISATRVASGLSSPVYMVEAPDNSGRAFIVEKNTGLIKILDLATGQISATPFLNLGGSISTGSEQGLLSMAFHPDFASNGRFFVSYTNTSGDTRISEFSLTSANVANPASERVILGVNQPFSNHNGGWIGFGPDGFLYVALGDGGSGGDPGNRAQNTNELLGKILRLDINGTPAPGLGYAIPQSNPFVGVPGADEIWALGLRNPWRASFDSFLGDFWIADVGQGTREEVNFQDAGAPGGRNYGWRWFEGTSQFTGGSPPSGLTAPIHEYSHVSGPNGGFSITGGYVYRGTSAALEGEYFFADYVSRQVWSLYEENGASVRVVNRTLNITPNLGDIDDIASFAEDRNGNLYVVGLDGEIHRLNAVESRADAGNSLDGGAGRDKLVGGDGNDTLAGGTGSDTLDGGAGTDTANYAASADNLFINLFAGQTTGEIGGGDVLRNLENVIGGFGGNTIVGNSAANVLDGRDGNDLLYGNAGADTLIGAFGADTLFGEADDDILYGFWGQDLAWGGSGNDLIFGEFDNDILLGEAGNDLIDGGDQNDTLYGWLGADTLLGGEGNDTLFGEQDNDLLFGWLGADLLWGGDGNDTLWGEQDNDTLLGETGNDLLLGVDGSDVLYGWLGNDTLYGWTGDDVLWGEAGNDLMLGEDGNDTFIGGLGRDTMTGGQGADRFFSAFSEIAAGEVDLLTDYDVADRYLFQTGAQIQYFNFNAPNYVGAGIHVQVQGGVFILDVLGANASQLQAQTLFF